MNEVELLEEELAELQVQYDSLWHYFNTHHPFRLGEWLKLQLEGEEE